MTQLKAHVDVEKVAEGSVTEYGRDTVLGLATSARIPLLYADLGVLKRGFRVRRLTPSRSAGFCMDYELNEFRQPIGLPIADWSPPAWPSRDTLTGQYCRLESLNPQRHGDALFAAIDSPADAASWTYMAYGPFQSRADYQQWLDQYAGQADPQFYAIIDNQSQLAMGVAAYLRVMPASGSIEVGHIHYAPRLRRTTSATEAMLLMMQNAFRLGYRRYEWKCDALNAPSRAAAERLGFTFEGIFRQATVVKRRNRDTAWYAITDRDWPRIEAGFQRWLAAENFDAEGQQKQKLTF